MAAVYGNTPWDNKRELKKYGFLAAVVSVTMVAVMMFYAEDRGAELWTALFLTAGCVGFIGLICLRSNPMLWQQWFKKDTYLKQVAVEKQAVESLSTLPGNTFVFNHFIFELFRVEHLVLSDRGIFVLYKINHPGELTVDGNQLIAGTRSLESAISNIWRVCHLINIVIRKTFKVEMMPTPVFLVPKHNGMIDGFDGISIMDLSQFHDVFNALKPDSVDSRFLQGLAGTVRTRYIAG